MADFEAESWVNTSCAAASPAGVIVDSDEYWQRLWGRT